MNRTTSKGRPSSLPWLFLLSLVALIRRCWCSLFPTTKSDCPEEEAQQQRSQSWRIFSKTPDTCEIMNEGDVENPSSSPEDMCTDESKQNGSRLKVYIMAGQSNMLHMGFLNSGSQRFSDFWQSPEEDSDKGLVVSMYDGAYDPAVDYDKAVAKATKVIKVYKNKNGSDNFPQNKPQQQQNDDNAAESRGGKKNKKHKQQNPPATWVLRGYMAVPKTADYKLKPGYKESSQNQCELEGEGIVYRKDPGEDKPSVQKAVRLEQGRRYFVKITFFAPKVTNCPFYLSLFNTPGTLDRLVKREGQFPWLWDEQKHEYATRSDVFFQDARMCGGWAWNKDDQMVLDVDKLKTACRPLTVEKKGVWVGNAFGCLVGDYHRHQRNGDKVLLIRSAIGNRALDTDFRPPSSGPYGEDDSKWIGVEFSMMVEGVQKTLQNLPDIVPGYTAGQCDLAGFVWFQGHKDSCNKRYSSAYEANLVNFVHDVRRAFDAPQLPMVIGTIGFHGMDMKGTQKVVWQAQMDVGNAEQHPEVQPLSTTIDTRSFWRDAKVSPQNKDYHYNHNAETYILVGQALAQAMVELHDRNHGRPTATTPSS